MWGLVVKKVSRAGTGGEAALLAFQAVGTT